MTRLMLPPGKAVYDPTKRFTPGKAYEVIDEDMFPHPHDLFSVIVDDKGSEALVCREPGFDGCYLYDRAGWIECDEHGRPLLEPYEADAFTTDDGPWWPLLGVMLCFVSAVCVGAAGYKLLSWIGVL